MGLGKTRGGGCLLIILGGKLSDYNNENREGDGAICFNGFLWMGERNNQPKVGHYDRVHRVMTMGGQAVASFWPSN
jgi:hypothetical protein